MDRPKTYKLWTALALSVAAGCATAGRPAPETAATSHPAADTAVGQSAPPAVRAAPTTTGDDPVLAAMTAEIRGFETLEPAVREQMAYDLHQSLPELRPMLMQTYRGIAAYRRNPPGQPVAHVPPTAALPAAATAAAPAEPSGSHNSAPPPTSLPTGPPDDRVTLAAASVDAAQLAAAASGAAAAAATSGNDAGQTSAAWPGPVEGHDAASGEAALAAAVAHWERSSRQPPATGDDVRRHAQLRLLYLVAGRRDDALRAIPGIAPAQQDYWTEQVYALWTALDPGGVADANHRAAETRMHLDLAAARLGETATLLVKNAAFCSEVRSYGVCTRFENYELKPSQPLLLYAEVENFRSEPTPKGYHSALRASYQILDAQGHRVAEQDLGLSEEYCQNPRRDYFLCFERTLPQRIYTGRYTLQLTIEDTLGRKIGQTSLEFTVKE